MESRNHLSLRHAIAIVIGLIGVVGLLLAVLHGIEAALWAAAYWWLGALNSPGEAILYSVDSISTRGASGLMLEHHWRMMGALEAAKRLNSRAAGNRAKFFAYATLRRTGADVVETRHPEKSRSHPAGSV
jgi:hypothetical protein